jgi:hypothetical protein
LDMERALGLSRGSLKMYQKSKVEGANNGNHKDEDGSRSR